MPNIAAVLKEEIQRLARKEIRKQISILKKMSAQYRKEIAEMKRRKPTCNVKSPLSRSRCSEVFPPSRPKPMENTYASPPRVCVPAPASGALRSELRQTHRCHRPDHLQLGTRDLSTAQAASGTDRLTSPSGQERPWPGWNNWPVGAGRSRSRPPLVYSVPLWPIRRSCLPNSRLGSMPESGFTFPMSRFRWHGNSG